MGAAHYSIDRSLIRPTSSQELAYNHNFDAGRLVIENARLNRRDNTIASSFIERFATDPQPILCSTGAGPATLSRNDIVLEISTNFGFTDRCHPGWKAGQRRSFWLHGDAVKHGLEGTCDGNSSKVKRFYLILVKRLYLRDLAWLIGNSTVERNSLQIPDSEPTGVLSAVNDACCREN